MSWPEAAVRWYGVLAVLTWAFAPAARWLGSSLSDRGSSIARPLAALLAIYPSWLLASAGLIPFGKVPLWLTVVVAGVLGWGVLIRRGHFDRSWLASLLLVELASLALFAAYVWLHGFTPEVLGTEKPMDVAFLASSERTTVIPPPDPWFAGQPINYYYLGYLVQASIGRLAGVPPPLAFNLALASIFSVTGIAAFGIAGNVLRPAFARAAAVAGGLLSLFLVTLAGNLYAPWRLLQDARATIGATWWDSAAGIGWRSSRIVCDGPRVGNLCPPPATETINEFPFFSFLLGDLHPHLMALPYTLVAIALAWNLARRGLADGEQGTVSSWLWRVAASGAIAGSLYALNAWDLPTFGLIVALGVWAGSGRSLAAAWKPLGLLAVAAIVPWLPFTLRYVPPTEQLPMALPGGLDAVPLLPRLLSAVAPYGGERTSAAEYLTQFGIPYLVAIAFVAAGLANPQRWPPQRIARTLLVAATLTLIPGVFLAAPVIPLCGIPLAFALGELRCQPAIGPRAFALSAFAGAWALSIAVEFIYVRDLFASRMNTLFKFYYQAWTLYALGAAIAIILLWSLAARGAWLRAFVAAAALCAVLAGLAYPVVASYQWTNHFSGWQGLDGLAYGAESDPDDVAAIRWLAQHAGPGDVVLEAAGCSYLPFYRLPFNRVSAFTGVPTIIGWGDNHQRQWRAGQPGLLAEIPRRQADVAAIYADPGSDLSVRYGVDWLFVGTYETGDWRSECATAGPYAGIERQGYPGPGWQEAFRSGQTRIYRRAGE